MTVIVGAYAIAWGRSEREESELLKLLALSPRVEGLELGWNGAIHPRGRAWLLDHLHPAWRLVVSSIPATMAAVQRNPRFGLGSPDYAGRSEALRHARKMLEDVRAMNSARGEKLVVAVEFHSAPQGGSPSDLERSLDEISSWDWDGADLLLEHVDARVETHVPSKGFLSLAEEIAVIRRSETPVRMLINWGRSAIELRDPDRVVEHLAAARSAGALGGIIFSGITAVDTPLGTAWSDRHAPFAALDVQSGDPESLLTSTRVAAALAVAGDVDYLGVKVTGSGSIASEASMVLESVALLAARPGLVQ